MVQRWATIPINWFTPSHDAIRFPGVHACPHRGQWPVHVLCLQHSWKCIPHHYSQCSRSVDGHSPPSRTIFSISQTSTNLLLLTKLSFQNLINLQHFSKKSRLMKADENCTTSASASSPKPSLSLFCPCSNLFSQRCASEYTSSPLTPTLDCLRSQKRCDEHPVCSRQTSRLTTGTIRVQPLGILERT